MIKPVGGLPGSFEKRCTIRLNKNKSNEQTFSKVGKRKRNSKEGESDLSEVEQPPKTAAIQNLFIIGHLPVYQLNNNFIHACVLHTGSLGELTCPRQANPT